MNIAAVVLQIRAANTSFANKVTGSVELAMAMEGGVLAEQAFVIHLADGCSPNENDSFVNQRLTERFGVIVVLKNDTVKTDIQGFEAYNRLDTIRDEIFVALLGWLIPGSEWPVSYSGGRVISLNRAWLWYQFEFESTKRLQTMYDPNAGALPRLMEFYNQWKIGTDDQLPLTGLDPKLPTDLLTDPVLQDLIKINEEFGEDFDNSFNNLEANKDL